MTLTREFIPDTNCVLDLPLHELDGSSFMSKDAYGHLFTATGALWRPNGRLFDESDDKVGFNDLTIFEATGTGTIEAWIYPTDGNSGTHAILATGQTGSGITTRLEFALIDGKLSCHLRVASVDKWVLATDAALADSTWHHVFVIQDGTSPVLIADGTQPAQTFSVTADKTIWFDDTAFKIRVKNINLGLYHADDSQQTNNPFGGIIGAFRYYNIALSLGVCQMNRNATHWRYR